MLLLNDIICVILHSFKISHNSMCVISHDSKISHGQFLEQYWNFTGHRQKSDLKNTVRVISQKSSYLSVFVVYP